jgi:hypothetical protein
VETPSGRPAGYLVKWRLYPTQSLTNRQKRMNLRSLAARRDPDCTDRRAPNSADHRIWGCLVAAMGAATTYRIGPLSVFQDEGRCRRVAHATTGAVPLALLQRRGSSSPMAMRRAAPPSRPDTTSSSRAKPQHRSPTANAKLQRRPAQRGPAAARYLQPLLLAVNQEERPSHDKSDRCDQR